MTVDIPSLRIASRKIEWAVLCHAVPFRADNEEIARAMLNEMNEQQISCGPHRVVSRQIITTEWEEAQ